MTVVNLALGTDRALFVTDSLVSGGAFPMASTKALALPHLGLVLAGRGHHALGLALGQFLQSGLPVGCSVLDIASTGPEMLRAIWSRQRCTEPSEIMLAGVTPSGEFAGFALRSWEDFAAVRLLPGFTYLGPSIDEPPPGAQVTPEAAAVPVAAVETAPLPPRPWRNLEHQAVAAAGIQITQARTPIGGLLIATYVDGGGVRQWTLRDLDK